jgi:hypothetical protein
MLQNEKDEKFKEIFEYLLKVANYDKSTLVRQKVRILQYIFNPENKMDTKLLFKQEEIKIEEEQKI